MATRQYDFIVGPETSTLPSIGTPTGDDDLISKGYADSHYVQGTASEASIAAVKAIAEADRADGDMVLVRATNNVYRFDSASADAGDDNFVLTPDAGTGRWIRLTILNRANTFTDTTQSTSKDTGGAVFEGGVGIEKNLHVGGNLTVDGDTTTMNTATLDVEDANITVNNGGNQATANSNTAGITVEMSDATDVRLGYDSSLPSRWKCGDTGLESEIMTVADDQEITGKKTYDASDGVHFKAITAPATPASGDGVLYYNSTDKSFHQIDDAGVDQVVGEIGDRGPAVNYVNNPNADAAITGWVDSGVSVVVSRTTTAAELPREDVHASALKFTIGAAGTDYTRFRFTRGNADAGKRFIISWAQLTGSTYATADLKLEVYTNAASNYGGAYTEVALDTDVSGDTNIEDLDGCFTSYFMDPNTDPYYEVRIIRVANGGGANDFITLNDVVIGPAGRHMDLAEQTISSAKTVVANRHYLTDTTGGPFTITLPPGKPGDRIRFSDASSTWDTNNLTLDGDGGETIDGSATLVLNSEGTWVMLMWDGTEWVSEDAQVAGSINLTGTTSAEFIVLDKATSNSHTIASGEVVFHPLLTVSAADTVTIDSGGDLFVVDTLTVDGTLVVNGTCRLLH